MWPKKRVMKGWEAEWDDHVPTLMEGEESGKVEENKFLLIYRYEWGTMKMQNHRNQRFERVSNSNSKVVKYWWTNIRPLGLAAERLSAITEEGGR